MPKAAPAIKAIQPASDSGMLRAPRLPRAHAPNPKKMPKLVPVKRKSNSGLMKSGGGISNPSDQHNSQSGGKAVDALTPRVTISAL